MTEKDTQTRLWQEITGMVVAAVILVMVAWLLVPEPLVGNPTQTELLSIRVETTDQRVLSWKPRTVVQRQTARAIVDYMATLHKHNTLLPAKQAWQGKQSMVICLRTEDDYQVVVLGKGQEKGFACGQDGLGLAGQVPACQTLGEYIWAQIQEDLSAGA
ncbi:MAG: hypothetical protein MR910_05130 [Clostridiales bacterium]|nr:hypothetical protein [Clostridiales bacterium]